MFASRLKFLPEPAYLYCSWIGTARGKSAAVYIFRYMEPLRGIRVIFNVCCVGKIMSNIIPFVRPRASVETVDWLVRRGYLKAEKRHSASAVHEALGRMRNEMERESWEYDPPPIVNTVSSAETK
jgi:hypothetical protein